VTQIPFRFLTGLGWCGVVTQMPEPAIYGHWPQMNSCWMADTEPGQWSRTGYRQNDWLVPASSERGARAFAGRPVSVSRRLSAV